MNEEKHSPQTLSRPGAVKQDPAKDYKKYMEYCQDERNWFKRARGEWKDNV